MIRRLLRRALRPSAVHDSLEDNYSEEAFRSREKYRNNYETIVDALCRVVAFDTILDIGSANGFLLLPAIKRGKTVLGVEKSPAVVRLLPPEVRNVTLIRDATEMGKLGEFDLVSCVEVAEHIPKGNSDALLDCIAQNAKTWVYFTAASPYQPGHGHINNQSQFYWINGLRKRGFDLDYEATETIVSELSGMTPAEWIPLNSLLFRRGEG